MVRSDKSQMCYTNTENKLQKGIYGLQKKTAFVQLVICVLPHACGSDKLVC